MKRLILPLFLLVLVSVLLIAVNATGSRAQPSAPRYEYLVIDDIGVFWQYNAESGKLEMPYDIRTITDIAKAASPDGSPAGEQFDAVVLGVLGADGWRVVDMQKNPFRFVFERPLP